MSKYSITLYFEGLTKQVSEIVLLHFGDIQLPNYKRPENAVMISSLVTIATVYFGASGAYRSFSCDVIIF